MVVDYLIGGQPNSFGVAPCPGLPRGRITQLWGHESAGKCVCSSTLVNTPDGVLTVGEVFERNGLHADCINRTTPMRYNLINRYGEVESTTHFTHNGRKPVYEITTKSGATVQSTGNHPHLVMDEAGFESWRQTRDLAEGDYMITLRRNGYGTNEVPADYAYMLGLLVADGCLNPGRISITNDDPTIQEFIQNEMVSLIQVPVRSYPRKNTVDYQFNGKEACAKLYQDSGLQPVRSAEKTLSAFIRTMNDTSLRSFLQGYYDCESHVDINRGTIEVTSASYTLLKQMKLMLHRFGLVSFLSKKTVKNYPDNQYWRLTLYGKDASLFVERVGARSKLRQDQMALMSPYRQGTNHDTVPNVSRLLRSLYCQGTRNREINKLCGDYMANPPRANITRERLQSILDTIGDDTMQSQRLRELTSDKYYFDPIVSIRYIGDEPTFDFAMESTASFIADGFVTHNTTLALTAAATICNQGGSVLYVDWENDIVPDYAAALGVPIDDPDRFELVQPETLEDGLKIIKAYVLAGVDLIVIDSVGAAVPKAVKDRDIKEVGEQTRVGLNAQRWSEFLPDIKGDLARHGNVLLGISQLRQKMSIGGGGYNAGPTTAPQGGEAWKFYSALRLELRRIQNEKANEHNVLTHKKEERVVGGVIKAKVVKCKLSSSQGREEIFYIRWGEGIDDLRSVMEIAIAHGVIKKSGSWYTFGEKRWQGTEQGREFFKKDGNAFQDLLMKVRPFLTVQTSDPVDEEDDDDDLDKMLAAGADTGADLSKFVEEMDLGIDG